MSTEIFSAGGSRELQDAAVVDYLEEYPVPFSTEDLCIHFGVHTTDGWSNAEAALYNTLVRLQDSGLVSSRATDGITYWRIADQHVSVEN